MSFLRVGEREIACDNLGTFIEHKVQGISAFYSMALSYITLNGDYHDKSMIDGQLYDPTNSKHRQSFERLFIRLLQGGISAIVLRQYKVLSRITEEEVNLDKGYIWLNITYNVFTKELMLTPVNTNPYESNTDDKFKVNLETEEYSGNLDSYKLIDKLLCSDTQLFKLYQTTGVIPVYREVIFTPTYSKLCKLGVSLKLDKCVDKQELQDSLQGVLMAVTFYKERFQFLNKGNFFENITLSVTQGVKGKGHGGFYHTSNLIVVQEGAKENRNLKVTHPLSTYSMCVVHELAHALDYYFKVGTTLTDSLYGKDSYYVGNKVSPFKTYADLLKQLLLEQGYTTNYISYACSYKEILARVMEKYYATSMELPVQYYTLDEATLQGSIYAYPVGDNYKEMFGAIKQVLQEKV